MSFQSQLHVLATSLTAQTSVNTHKQSKLSCIRLQTNLGTIKRATLINIPSGSVLFLDLKHSFMLGYLSLSRYSRNITRADAQ